MSSKKWKAGSLSFFRPRVKDLPEPVQSTGRSVGGDYKLLMQRKQGVFSGDATHLRYTEEVALLNSEKPTEQKGFLHSRSDSAGTLPIGGSSGDLLFLEIRCKQLKDERDSYEQLFMAEQLKNRRMVRRFATQELEAGQLEEMVYDAAAHTRLGLQLETLSERCGKLNLCLSNKELEVKNLAQRIKELEASGAASENLVEQHVKDMSHLREELAKSEANLLRAQTRLDERNAEFHILAEHMLRLENMISESKSDYQEQIMFLKEELAKSEFECFDLKRSLEDKTAEAKKLTELVNFLENQVSKAQQKMINIQGEIMHLKSDMVRSEGTWVESFCQLEKTHTKRITDVVNENKRLQDRIAQLEVKLQGKELSEGLDVDEAFEFHRSIDRRFQYQKSFSFDMQKDDSLFSTPHISPARFSSPYMSPARFPSPQRSPMQHASPHRSSGGSHGLIQALLDIGEASLGTVDEEELQAWQSKLAEVEMREYTAMEELRFKTQELADSEDCCSRLKAELLEEKERAKEEAEDLAQEMAELRYQLMEMLDQERELRARTEQASVHRVEELEAQLKRSRQETVAALARRRESEARLEAKMSEIVSLQLQLKNQKAVVNLLQSVNHDLHKRCNEKEVQAANCLIEPGDTCQADGSAVEPDDKGCVYGTDSPVQGADVRVWLMPEFGTESETHVNVNLTVESKDVNGGVQVTEECATSGPASEISRPETRQVTAEEEECFEACGCVEVASKDNQLPERKQAGCLETVDCDTSGDQDIDGVMSLEAVADDSAHVVQLETLSGPDGGFMPVITADLEPKLADCSELSNGVSENLKETIDRAAQGMTMPPELQGTTVANMESSQAGMEDGVHCLSAAECKVEEESGTVLSAETSSSKMTESQAVTCEAIHVPQVPTVSVELGVLEDSQMGSSGQEGQSYANVVEMLTQELQMEELNADKVQCPSSESAVSGAPVESSELEEDVGSKTMQEGSQSLEILKEEAFCVYNS